MAQIRSMLKRFDFETEARWTLDGCIIDGEARLTLADPVTPLPWASAWSAVPDFDGDGNAVLTPTPLASYAYAHAGDYGDMTLVFTVCHNGAIGADEWLYSMLRFDIAGPTALLARLDGEAGGTMSGTLENLGAPPTMYAKDGGFGGSFPSGAWRTVRVRIASATVEYQVVDVRALHYTGVDAVEPGTFSIIAATGLTGTPWLSGAGGGHAEPYVAVPVSGTVKLGEVYAYRLPDNVAALSTLTGVHDYTYDPTGMNHKRVATLFNLYHGGAWSGWTEAVDGDLSGVAVSGGDLILVGASMDNTADHPTRPALKALDLTYTETGWTSEEAMKALLLAVQALLNADATLTAYVGWNGTHVVSTRMSLPSHNKFGVWLEPQRTNEPPFEESPTAGGFVTKVQYHNIAVHAVMRLDESSAENALMKTGGLLDFTEAVITALRREHLGGTVQFVDIGDIEYLLMVPGLDKGCVSNRVSVRYKMPFFEA